MICQCRQMCMFFLSLWQLARINPLITLAVIFFLSCGEHQDLCPKHDVCYYWPKDLNLNKFFLTSASSLGSLAIFLSHRDSLPALSSFHHHCHWYLCLKYCFWWSLLHLFAQCHRGILLGLYLLHSILSLKVPCRFSYLVVVFWHFWCFLFSKAATHKQFVGPFIQI